MNRPWAACDCYNNALARTINGLYKAKMIRRRAFAQKAGARIDVQFVDFELFDESEFVRRERTQ